jgi:hypothetical protein
LVEVLIFGCAYERIADETCSESTLRRRRNGWIELGLMEWLREICLKAHDRLVGLEPSEVAVDCCVTKAPRVGERVFIPRGTVHRLSTAGEEVRILEISFGEFDEEDIVRLDAVYGRVAQKGLSLRRS